MDVISTTPQAAPIQARTSCNEDARQKDGRKTDSCADFDEATGRSFFSTSKIVLGYN